MAAAIGLYRQMGFRPIPPYYDTPMAGTRFFAMLLDDPADPRGGAPNLPGGPAARRHCTSG